MSADTPTELETFHHFLGEAIQSGQGGLTPERAVEAFRHYQADLARFHQDTQVALDESARGESGPLDTAALKASVRERLAQEGITD